MLNEHKKKVDKIIFKIMMVSIVLTLISYLSGRLTTLVPTISVTIGSLVLAILFKNNASTKTIRIVIFISLLIMIHGFMYASPSNAIEFAILGVCMTTIYFNKRAEIIGCVAVTTQIVYLWVVKKAIDGADIQVGLIALIFASVILYYVAKWGYDNLEEVKIKENESIELLKDIEKTIEVVNVTTESLDSNIGSCNENLQVIHLTSESINKTLESVTHGIMEQSNGLNEITSMVYDASGRIDEVKGLSSELTNISKTANDIVSEGYKDVNNMDDQMKIINEVSTKSFETIKNLANSMEKVNEFLNGISGIAKQTNLLALNASIEASRAGDAGKGFAVVAGEIKSLAGECDTRVKEINNILSTIHRETAEILNGAEKENTAVLDGKEMINNVNNSFEKIRDSFINIDNNIVEEVNRIEKVVEAFERIKGEVESIASISQEHSAATEELMATTEENYKNIETAYESMKKIRESSIELKSVSNREK